MALEIRLDEIDDTAVLQRCPEKKNCLSNENYNPRHKKCRTCAGYGTYLNERGCEIICQLYYQIVQTGINISENYFSKDRSIS
jgi:hypothetical protein